MNPTSDRISRLSPEKLALLKRAIDDASGPPEPIAVVGMGCRFPGCRGVDQYWGVINDGVDVTSEIPKSRWDVDAFFDKAGGPGKMTTRRGGFLEDVDRFDAQFFGVSPREAERMDPQQRLLLEVVWEALEYGAIAPSDLRGSPAGVFVGVGGVDYSRIPVQLDNYYEQITAHSGTGNALSIVANRISYILDLHGPSLSIDTACSSSLVATHLAIRSLRSGECDVAIAGGVSLILTPETTLAFSQAHMLSPEGRCRPFDSRANGYVRGEGCGAVVLKRLSDAVSAGDMVMATLRGSAVNQDGRTSGIAAPRGPAQVAVIRKALADAGLGPGDVSYIETHGTGTPLGDPIESQALAEVFRDDQGDRETCYLGSVKANVGHTETCAGMASLVKTILMLHHEFIPQQANFERLNPNIDFRGTRLRIAEQPMPWPAGSQRPVAGISSFGFGGTNAHVVLEQASAASVQRPVEDRPKHLLVLSAKSPGGLPDVAQRYLESLPDADDLPLADLCHTAAVGRDHFDHRLAIPAADPAALIEALGVVAGGGQSPPIKQSSKRSNTRLRIAFLFTGQGAQYQGMGRQLYETNPIFREALDECDEILQDLLPQRLLTVLFDDPSDDPLLNQTQYTQPALFSLEYALSRWWRWIGVEPAAVIGHSVGEYVASCLAGVFSLEDGLQLIAHRARLMQSLPSGGVMAVIFAERDRVAKSMLPYRDDVAIAAHNGPQLVVISGRRQAVSELVDQFESQDVRTQMLNVSHAFHSPLMDPILDEFESLAEEITFAEPRIPLISNRTGRVISNETQSARYWRDHLRHTVCFAEGVAALEQLEIDVALEIGPDTTLLGMARRGWNCDEIAWLPSLRAGWKEWDVLIDSVADLYTRGADIKWDQFDQPWPRRRIVLPTYPFQGESFWYDMSHRVDHHASLRIVGPSHPLLGGRLEMAGEKSIFEVSIHQNHPEYLADHCVDQSTVVPAAAFIEQALAAAKEVFGSQAPGISTLTIQQALVLTEDQRRTVQLIAGPEHKGECPFEVYSQASGSDNAAGQPWVRHASGTLRNNSGETSRGESIDCEALFGQLSSRIESDDFYEQMADCGLRYGPSFQVVKELRTADGQALARLHVPDNVHDERGQYQLHPAILDGCWQAVAGVVSEADADDGTRDLFLPTGVQKVRIHGRLDTQHAWVHVRRKMDEPAQESVEADIVLIGDDGTVVAELIGASAQRVASHGRAVANDQSDWLYELKWQLDAGDSEEIEDGPTQWLVFADKSGLAGQLAGQLVSRGHSVTTVARGNAFQFSDEAPSGIRCFELNPLRASGYGQLLEHLGKEGSASRLRVVDLWGADSPAVNETCGSAGEISHEICGHALLLLKELGKSTKWKSITTNLVTHGGQAIDREDTIAPTQSTLWGLGRSALVEMPHLACRLIDLDPNLPLDQSSSDLLSEVVRPRSDDQVGYRQGDRYVARLRPAPDRLDGDTDSSPSIPVAKRYSLRLTTPGSFDALRYVPVSKRALGRGEVEMKVHSAGLNFSDVLKALGLYPGIKDEVVPLGIEFAGEVTALGEGVERFEIGQRVMGVAPYSFASHTVSPEYALVATPDGISDDEAATIPITFLTAWQALCRLAHLRRGERVLIHAGAGGVGQAAIQIAQHIGAEVFATAGSDEKREFLRSLGVEHVMNSRTLDFADDILEITSGSGVDVVLNSLPGEAITKSLSILSAYGRFLEIGKTDIYQNRMIGLRPFQDNLSYFAIDLDRMLRQRPDDIRDMYQELMPLLERGEFQPLPLHAFPGDRVVDAFRYMAQRKNIGKVVVSLPDQQAQRQRPPEDAGVCVRDDATYLVTGGLGALGLQLADWLGSQGARWIALMSRRGPSEQTEKVLQGLRDSGVSVAVIRGDVSDDRSLEDALSSIPETFPALRGVIHAAGVLDDGIMMEMDLERLDRAMSPKVQGAWNLHRTIKSPLDFFVMFSSVAGTIGSPGQSNYAAGNAFLDGLASYRRSRSLPATSIAWGPWDDAGMAGDDEVRRQLKSRGMRPLRASSALEVLDRIIGSDLRTIAVTDVHWNTLLGQLPPRATTLMDDLRTSTDQGDGSRSAAKVDEELCRKLQSADSEQRIAIVSQFIRVEVSRVMGGDPAGLDVDQPLASLGLDSLMGMELKSHIESKLGIEVPAASLFDGPSVTSLAEVVSGLLDDSEGADGTDSQTAEQSAGSEPTNGKPKTDRGGKRESMIVAFGGGASRSAGTRRGLFCLHPVGGDLRCYQQLAKYLPDFQIFGLRASGLDGRTTVHSSMDEMISDYTAAIRKTQPEGPYFLMGWSTGGIFAYEVARRLQTDAAGVGSLIMLDSPQPSVFQDVDLSDDARFLTDMVDFANYFSGTSMRADYMALRDKSEEDALAMVLQMSQRERVLPPETTVDYLRRLVTVCKQHVRLLRAYRPQPCGLAVHLVRPEDTSMLTEATKQQHDDDFGWGSLVDLQTHRVPGHHFTMLTGNNAKALAKTLENLLTTSESTPLSR